MRFLSLLATVAGLAHGAVSGSATEARATTESYGSECPNISPGPATLSQLANLPLSPFTDPVSIESIRNTLALYPFAVDGRNWPALSRIFASNARANYSEPLGVSNGVDNITQSISAGISNFAATQHRYGTQYINICSLNSAISVTYYEASHFFSSTLGPAIENDSQTLFATGRYEDTWARQDDGSWKIVNRNLVYMVTHAAKHAPKEVMKVVLMLSTRAPCFIMQCKPSLIPPLCIHPVKHCYAAYKTTERWLTSRSCLISQLLTIQKHTRH